MSVSKVKRKTTQLYIFQLVYIFISLSNKMQAHCHYASGPMGPLTVACFLFTPSLVSVSLIMSVCLSLIFIYFSVLGACA